MKKTILIIALFAFGCLQLKAEKNKLENEPVKEVLISPSAVSLSGGGSKGITESGFFAHLGVVMPSENYYFSFSLGKKFGLGPSLDLGHMFRIAELDDAAIGVRATWFSALYTNYVRVIDDTTAIFWDIMQISVLKVGPYFTYGLSDNAAIDVYYQIAPTILIDLNYGLSYFGVTHSIGFGFRFKMISVGMDYNFGNLKDRYLPDFKINTNHLRIFAGVKI